MGRKATDRIARTMSKLRMEGKLDKPYYPNGKPKPPSKRKKVVKPAVTPEQKKCCMYKYGGNLPQHFRRCPDCTDNSS